ncbi:MAG: hypothetical protein IJ341_03805 [Bacteroidales bacterium]|nr:hypothetical protein [Bacteroidales bacterium]
MKRVYFIILLSLVIFGDIFAQVPVSRGLRITEEKGFFAIPLEQFNLGINPTLAYSFWFKINKNGGGAYNENNSEAGSHILINASPIDENSPVGIWFGHHYVQLSNGRFSASMRTNTNCPGPHFIKENNPIKEEEWHHILVNMKYSNGLYFSIYHNGEKFGETTPNGGNNNCNVIDFKNNSCIRIGVPGNYDLNTKQPLDITIDNVQLYNSFFDEDEISLALTYNAPSSLPEGLIGLWNFEENSENMNYLINEIGNNNEVAFISAGVPIDLYSPVAPDFSNGVFSGIEDGIVETPRTKAYTLNGLLYIESNEEINSVAVYDAMGRILTPNPSPVERGATNVQIPLPTTIKGVIMVKVNSEVVKVIVE